MFSELLAEPCDLEADALLEFWHDPENINELLTMGLKIIHTHRHIYVCVHGGVHMHVCVYVCVCVCACQVVLKYPVCVNVPIISVNIFVIA
jgi:hypothetical protein